MTAVQSGECEGFMLLCPLCVWVCVWVKGNAIKHLSVQVKNDGVAAKLLLLYIECVCVCSWVGKRGGGQANRATHPARADKGPTDCGKPVGRQLASSLRTVRIVFQCVCVSFLFGLFHLSQPFISTLCCCLFKRRNHISQKI